MPPPSTGSRPSPKPHFTQHRDVKRRPAHCRAGSNRLVRSRDLDRPDSDVWTHPDLLGRELEGRGAKVAVLKLAPGPDGTKVGLDDPLCTQAPKALDQLPRLGLKHATFTRVVGWWREWSRHKDSSEAAALQTRDDWRLPFSSRCVPSRPGTPTAGTTSDSRHSRGSMTQRTSSA